MRMCLPMSVGLEHPAILIKITKLNAGLIIKDQICIEGNNNNIFPFCNLCLKVVAQIAGSLLILYILFVKISSKKLVGNIIWFIKFV